MKTERIIAYSIIILLAFLLFRSYERANAQKKSGGTTLFQMSIQAERRAEQDRNIRLGWVSFLFFCVVIMIMNLSGC